MLREGFLRIQLFYNMKCSREIWAVENFDVYFAQLKG